MYRMQDNIYATRHIDFANRASRQNAEEKADYHIFTRYHGIKSKNPVINKYPIYRPRKSQQFYIMQLMGRNVVPYKTVGEWYKETPRQYIVVYTDEGAHASEGKSLMNADYAALQGYQDMLASMYIPKPDYEDRTVSYRILVIGSSVFHLKMTSSHDWMSNKGTEVYHEIIELGLSRSERESLFVNIPSIHRPLFALDYVTEGVDHWYIDFNTAPGIPDNIAVLLNGGNLMDELAHWYSLHPDASPI